MAAEKLVSPKKFSMLSFSIPSSSIPEPSSVMKAE